MQQESFSDLFLRQYRFFFSLIFFFFSFCNDNTGYRTRIYETRSTLFTFDTCAASTKRDIDIQIISAIVVTIETMGFFKKGRRRDGWPRRNERFHASVVVVPLYNITSFSSRRPSSILRRAHPTNQHVHARTHPLTHPRVLTRGGVYRWRRLFRFVPRSFRLLFPFYLSDPCMEGRETWALWTFLTSKGWKTTRRRRSSTATRVAVAPRPDTRLPRKFQSYKADITVPRLHACTIERRETIKRQERREER